MNKYIVHFRILGTTIADGYKASEEVEAEDVISAEECINDRYDRSVDVEEVNQL